MTIGVFILKVRGGRTNPVRNIRIREPEYSHLQQANQYAPAGIFKLFNLKASTRMLQATNPAVLSNHALLPALHRGAA